jgi:MOSC domain-containing protein
MLVEVGQIEAIYRYPVKSMAAEPLSSIGLGWYGIHGDRRLALRRVGDHSGMPWLTAGRLPELVLFAPRRNELRAPGEIATHVRTPDGESMPIFSNELAEEIECRYGARVEMVHLRHGIFDETAISAIATDTVCEIGHLCGRSLEPRRFRPNIVVRPKRTQPFQEDGWVGGVLSFGDEVQGPAVAVTMRDERCAMVNIDPDSAVLMPEVMKAVVGSNSNYAGVYSSVIRTGQLRVGQPVFLTSNRET